MSHGFQVRDKDATTRELVALTRLVLAAVRPGGATVIVDDRLDVALAAGADGVHLGADDLSVADARRVAPDLVIGATCRDAAAVERAAADGATLCRLRAGLRHVQQDRPPGPARSRRRSRGPRGGCP